MEILTTWVRRALNGRLFVDDYPDGALGKLTVNITTGETSWEPIVVALDEEPIVCFCGAPCQDNHGLCDACEQWVATLDGAA